MKHSGSLLYNNLSTGQPYTIEFKFNIGEEPSFNQNPSSGGYKEPGIGCEWEITNIIHKINNNEVNEKNWKIVIDKSSILEDLITDYINKGDY